MSNAPSVRDATPWTRRRGPEKATPRCNAGGPADKRARWRDGFTRFAGKFYLLAEGDGQPPEARVRPRRRRDPASFAVFQAATSAARVPRSVELTAETGHRADPAPPDRLGGDKGYDYGRVSKWLSARRIKAVIRWREDESQKAQGPQAEASPSTAGGKYRRRVITTGGAPASATGNAHSTSSPSPSAPSSRAKPKLRKA